jgi:hypothetical protein
MLTLHYKLPVTPQTPLFVIGDIHGHSQALKKTLKNFKQNLKTTPNLQLVFLGDIIDRGPNSLKCLQLVAQAKKEFNAITLLGNHEQFMLLSLWSTNSKNQFDAQYNWMRNGGKWASPNYNQKNLEELKTTLEELNLGPDSWKSHFKSGNCLCIHAGIPKTEGELPKFLDLNWENFPAGNGDSFYHPSWLREPFLSDATPRENFVLHGHSARDYTHMPANNNRFNFDASQNQELAAGLVTENNVTLFVEKE